MTFLSLLAASFTFTATATGVEKGTPIEFPFVGEGSDRTYEALFVIDGSVDAFCRGLEAAGCLRGKPENVKDCILWPVGCQVSFTPSLDDYLESHLTDGESLAPTIYTGGLRLPDGRCDAETNMPMSVFSAYSLAQSPVVFGAHYEQGAVYHCHIAKQKIEKGTRVSFTLSWKPSSRPTPLSLVVRPGNATEVIRSLKNAAATNEVDALIDFDGSLTVSEAKTVAEALAVVDSHRVKINGVRAGHLYFRAFLPMVKWRDRQERLVQPFELTLAETNKLIHVDEDWSVEGLDPKLTPHEIRFSDASQYPNTDTCFIFAKSDDRLSKIYKVMEDMNCTKVSTWYIFVQE